MGHTPDRTPTKWKGRQVFVTGASAGIGAATAEALAREGAHVVLAARRTERLERLASRIRDAHGAECSTVALDVTEPDSIAAVRKEAPGLYEDTALLVNNAGLARGVDPLHKADPADWQTMIDTNVMGLLRLTREIVPHMMERNDGHIVNIGSVAGRWVYPGGGVYCATKHAVRAISEGLRMDLIGSGVRVTNIEPGLVETEFSIVRLGDEAKAAKVYERTTPLVAEDIADAVLFAVTRPRHVNLQELVIFPTDQAAVTQVHRYDASP